MYKVGDVAYFIRDNSLIMEICEGEVLERELNINYVLLKVKVGRTVFEQRVYTRKLYKTREKAINACLKAYAQRLGQLQKRRKELDIQIETVSDEMIKLFLSIQKNPD